MTIRASVLLAAGLLAVSAPAAAQETDGAPPAPRPGSNLDATMRAFVRAVAGREPAAFFPRRGDWTWYVAHRTKGEPNRVGVWRFPAAQTDSAIWVGGPVCNSFNSGELETGGALLEHAGLEEPPLSSSPVHHVAPWRRVRGTRFVPPGEPAESPVFVEWRREDGRWVVAAFGDERFHGRPEARVPNPHTVTRDGERGAPLRLPLPADGAYAAGMDWYQQHVPIEVNGHRLLKYGIPRQLGDGDVVRYGSLHGVPVYVEPGDLRRPTVVYVALTPDGSFQPYQYMTGDGCGG
ncbi:MAG TPA: hypothetical protein VF541_11580 [Longimicrobium sp.]